MIVRGLLIIFACLLVAEGIVRVLQLPLPASIIGLLLLFGLLQTGVVAKQWVEQVAKFMLDYLVLMVIPACVSIMQYLHIIAQELWVLLLATIISTVLVLLVTGKTHQLLRKLSWRWGDDASDRGGVDGNQSGQDGGKTS